ncbi:hypothetical protein SLEP1_g27662 [Rubroshorea leprosula]|uniref:Uncharacterized protein n=1 Tax=Rubroshorea leprosula TaxID=152421 RepID=A0AAV5JR95_9ROSI|nr:hypothetical protein SLEP1_g27662 [Rubroshorea leprosula]
MGVLDPSITLVRGLSLRFYASEIFLEILHGFVSDIVMITDASQWEFVNAGTCRHVY